MRHFQYGVDSLDVSTAMQIALQKLETKLTPEAKRNVVQSRLIVDQIVQSNKTVYGINTGFGPLCDTKITSEEINHLQKNLLLSHSVGVGEPIKSAISRLMIICKIHALSLGYSGVRIDLIERLQYFLTHDLIPVVPEQGSVGASGDLAPLAHLFLPLIGEGEFWINGEQAPSAPVLQKHQLAPLDLQAKEGLALINGTQFILAHSVVGLDKMKYLLDLADLAGAMSLESYQGSTAPFTGVIHRLRSFAGSLKVAERMRKMLQGSQNIRSHKGCDRVQDPYSIRCIPQVHGASRNAYKHLLELCEIELNSVTDNPIITSDGKAISGGNFHGQPLAMALDYASVAAAELGNISDRRCYLLLEGHYGLPRFLTENGGLNSGMMIPQYTTAALVSENKSLCWPASADSIPTSMGQEDHVSMGSISGRKFNQILTNLEKILAIELMYAAQALEFRRPNTFSEIIENNYQIIRRSVKKLDQDRLMRDDIEKMISLVQDRVFIVT